MQNIPVVKISLDKQKQPPYTSAIEKQCLINRFPIVMNKKTLTEADIRTKFITPALAGADGNKWNVMTQLREEIFFTLAFKMRGRSNG